MVLLPEVLSDRLARRYPGKKGEACRKDNQMVLIELGANQSTSGGRQASKKIRIAVIMKPGR